MQYFFLICTHYDECCFPEKIFLQKNQAIDWGRRLAMKLASDGNFEIVLYRQSITRNGSMEKVQTLAPYNVDSEEYFEQKTLKGADWDIDINR